MNDSRAPGRQSRHLVRLAVLWVLVPAAGSWAGTQLPVPCTAVSCGPKTSGFVTSGAATAVQSGSTLAVHQTSNNAILNWSTFNISADGKVTFVQPSATSIALNRIFDADPSSIFGALSANGQIYLINANGFLFGATSTVNVAGLIASSLNITDGTFQAGILSPPGFEQPALGQFHGDAQNFTDTTGTALLNTGSITVQSGAAMTANGGRLLLAAPTVTNGGSLSAPDGQIVLAGGQNVYLQASDQPSLRGLIVEVDPGTTAASQLASLSNPAVSNLASGQLSAPRGNVTLVGLAVNQDGRISATTTVSANGSVTLEAADTVVFSGNGGPLSAKRGGELVLGPQSSIQILPEYADTATAVDAQQQLPSTITLDGQQVFMHGGSIVAPSATLTVSAEADPSNGVQPGGNPNARIRIDPGTTIDLSGSDAVLPMDANLVTVQLRSNEFADDPTQRNGALRGQTVTVDVRADGGLGTPIADVSSAIASVGKTIAQRTEAGGTVSLVSEGDVVFSPGASINVAGGATTYLGGSIQTTTLIGANGQLVDIGSANPLQSYTGLVNPTLTQTYDKWGVQEVVPTPGLSHYESTYQQGAPGGAVQFEAPSLVIGGTLQAGATNGPYQRGPLFTTPNTTVPVGDAVPGGTLTIGGNLVGAPVGSNQTQYDFIAPTVVVAAHANNVAVSDNAPLPPQTLDLPAATLTSDGFTVANIYTNTTFTVPAGLPLLLPPGSSLSVQASRIDIDSSITDLGGRLTFQSELTAADQNLNQPTLGLGLPRLGIGIGDGVTLDVSGQWTNDSIQAGGFGSGPTLQNAGALKFQLTQPGGEIVFGNDVVLKADGGAWLQIGGTVTGGSGGSVSIDASPSQSALQFGQALTLQAFGVGTAAGGSLALAAPRIDVSQSTGGAWTEAQRVDDLNGTGPQVLALYAPLFSSLGLSSVSLTATGAAAPASGPDVLTIAAGTQIDSQTSSLKLNPGYQAAAGGGTVDAFSQVVTLPEYLRPPTSVALTVTRTSSEFLLGALNYGTLDVQAGSAIRTDPGASISLSGEGDIAIAGTLQAPGGTVSVQLPHPDTGSGFDPGYLPTLGIDLAPTAVIDVSGGSPVLTPNASGLLLGTLRSGGSVNITAQRGNVVLEPGSLIDFAGSSALLDIANPNPLGGYTREVVASPGGSLTLGSAESIQMLGNLNGQAGAGGNGTAAAGSLEIDLTRSEVIAGQPNQQPLQIDLVSDTTGQVTPPVVNVATIGVAQIQRSGIDSLILNTAGLSPGGILIDTGEPLALARSVVFDTQSLAVGFGIDAQIAAPFFQLGNPQTKGTGATPPPPTAGTGTLDVAAQQIILLGNSSLLGVANATLSSQGDVQLQGTATQAGVETGSLQTAGNLNLDAARVYPDTFTAFSLQALDVGGRSGNTVTIGQTTASPGTPLSANGAVSIQADDVVVNGTLLAPFGQISLTANDALTLANGSLVSVSGAGSQIPYGQTQANGAQWIYTTPAGISTVSGTPAKQVVLTAPNVTVAPSATLNLQGGGDLYAYEWIPGTGGLKDSLGTPSASGVSGLYAILPAQQGLAAPFDPEESTGSSPTQTVYLSGGAGLAAGYYSLLPPRYALAPNAVLVQLEPGIVSASGGQIGTLANGVPVVAGYVSSGTTGLHSGSTLYEGIAVYPSGYAQELAAYNLSNASSYFSGIAAQNNAGPVPVPADAGSLAFSVLQSQALTGQAASSFNLLGNVLTAAASGGRGALINISAPDLEITAGDAAVSPGVIAVSGTVLQGWNASALTLGGSTPGTLINTANAGAAPPTANVAVAANSVTVDSGVSLTADQILLVAQQSIDVKSGATLASTSGKNGSTLQSLPTLEDVTLTDTTSKQNALPEAALLAVSDLALPVVVSRSGVATPGVTTPGVATPGATITLEPGSVLNSGGALAVDAPGSVALNGTLNGKGAAWSLASDSIAFVGGKASTDTLNLDPAVTASLAQAGTLRLTSMGAIDIDTPVSLGASAASAAPSLAALTLAATTINNPVGADATFGAADLTVGGIATSVPAVTPQAGSGTLTLIANTLNLAGDTQSATSYGITPSAAPYALAVNGFGATLAQVAGPLITSGSGALAVGGTLTLNAVALTPAKGSTTSIGASGALTIGAPTTAAGSEPAAPVGGALSLTATSVSDAGAILAPSGMVTLAATAGDLTLAPTAVIQSRGTLATASGGSAASPGGAVSLSATGNVTLAAGSSIGVAGEQAAPAGSIAISGGQTVTLAGTLQGAAGSGGTGGSFSVDAGTLAGGLTPLATTLMGGGFSNAVDVRVRSGDLVLAPSGTDTGTLDANRITLTADTGAVSIAGTLNAPSAAERGSITLSGGTGVTLLAGGQLHADGAGAAGLGGEIVINSTCAACSITLAPGSVITTSGAGQLGELVLRAPALSAGNDVAINLGAQGLGADVSKVGQVIVEPVLTFQTTGATVNSDLSNDVTTASTYLTAASPVIAGRLTAANGTTPVLVEAGVELQDAAAGDALVLNSTLDLSTYSAPTAYGSGQAPQVIDVGVRAAGSVSIAATISDGFINDPNTNFFALTSTPSASFNFVAGADLGSANPSAVLKGSAANLTLVTSTTPSDGMTTGVGPAVVRTGTGDINLTAAGNVIFQGATSVYTGGEVPANVIGPVPLLNGALLQNFGADGGNVRVTAGVDVVGAPVGAAFPNADNGNASVTAWQLRQGNQYNPAQIGINFAAFDWNIGALAGGDVSVSAGRNVVSVSAATADTLVSAANTVNGTATAYGVGGGLSVTAAGDIQSAQVFVADGVGTLTAGGGLSSAYNVAASKNINQPPVGSSIAMDDSQVSVWARNDVVLSALYNPTFAPQLQGQNSDVSGQFFTYGPGAAVSLSSSAGNVVFAPNASDGTMASLLGSKAVASNPGGFLVAPPSLTLQAVQGDVYFHTPSPPVLYPSATGQLVVYAGRDIVGSGGGVELSDTPVDTLPTAANPQIALANTGLQFEGLAPFLGDVHAGDTTPALITAGRNIDDLSLSLPKAATLIAGQDILNLEYAGQNTAPTDTTLIAAGRDLVDASSGTFNFPGIQLGGPGSLDLMTGRNLNLGFGNGIVTTGNLANANLPSAQGASITAMVGYGTQGADESGFLKSIIAASPTYQAELISYVNSLATTPAASFAQAETGFASLSAPQQSTLIDDVFFNALLLSGREANNGSGVGFKNGYAAIDALFPNSRAPAAGTSSPYQGDLTLTSSQIYTFSGGDINLLVPGGKIDVGLANPPANLPKKSPSQLGIVAEGTGDVNIFTTGASSGSASERAGDVNVNQSRVFTLGGGNILIWSTLGSIDAGNGSKSSLSVPPPIVLISATGTISLDFAGSLSSGSGIRTIQTNPDVPPGNVDLDAPVGTVNAGDAGIGAAGNINIAAAHVIGVNNINFGGTATGVPSDLSGLGATLAGASSVASGSTNSSTSQLAESNAAKEAAAPLSSTALSWLDVFVIGLGEENCNPNDLECLHRQKPAAP